MKYSVELLKSLQLELARIFAIYGDEPDELMYKLECLVLEWYEKGVNHE